MDKEISNNELTKLHYPILWESKNGNIEIQDKHGKQLNSKHEVYIRELGFIEEQISKYREYEGEIVTC
jgi:hypothetical protein|tara:strand:+ start:668 stop:871 length:204 start_codon:yes stop_codon:yes gene_type:complete